MSSESYLSGNIQKSIFDLLNSNNIEFFTQSGTEVAIYCLFHENTNSPACYINTKTGLWQCFNPSCGKKGNLRQLYHHITGKTFHHEWILDPINLQRQLDLSLESYEEEKELTLDTVSIDYDSDEDLSKISTLIDRGFSPDILKHFEIGFSEIKERVVIPVRDNHFKLVGLIGRAVNEWQNPRYLYNKGFRRADVLFNIQNAKVYDSVIVCEGSLDAIKVAQSGFMNVVASLGAKVSQNQIDMLKKYFDKIVVFSDNDDAGAEMSRVIIDQCCGKDLYTVQIPDGLKDPGDMTEHQIVDAINNKKNILEN